MSSTSLTLTPATARRLAISCQRLAGPQPTADAAGIMDLFGDLGCVQIDPIRAVERTQLLVLWSRLGAYDPAELDQLLWEDRRLFEYWAHAASIVLTEDFPIYWRHMRDWAQGDKPWVKRAKAWMADNHELHDHVLDELRTNGPLASKDLNDLSRTSWESSGWTNGQNVRLMLGYLWEQGEILVSYRRGLTKYWDLRDRCLPDWTPRDELGWPEVVRRAAQKSLKALGVARPPHINLHFTRGNYPGLTDVLEQLKSEGSIIPVRIVAKDREWPGPWYIHASRLPLLERIGAGEWAPRTTLLSPFDNLICDRDRTQELFEFHFRIEIYVPKAKRQYGYYVLPILHGDRLIGRIDPKLDRKSGRLSVNAIYVEAEAPVTHEVQRAVVSSIQELAAFLGAKRIDCGEQVPDLWRKALN